MQGYGGPGGPDSALSVGAAVGAVHACAVCTMQCGSGPRVRTIAKAPGPVRRARPRQACGQAPAADHCAARPRIKGELSPQDVRVVPVRVPVAHLPVGPCRRGPCSPRRSSSSPTRVHGGSLIYASTTIAELEHAAPQPSAGSAVQGVASASTNRPGRWHFPPIFPPPPSFPSRAMPWSWCPWCPWCRGAPSCRGLGVLASTLVYPPVLLSAFLSSAVDCRRYAVPMTRFDTIAARGGHMRVCTAGYGCVCTPRTATPATPRDPSPSQLAEK